MNFSNISPIGAFEGARNPNKGAHSKEATSMIAITYHDDRMKKLGGTKYFSMSCCLHSGKNHRNYNSRPKFSPTCWLLNYNTLSLNSNATTWDWSWTTMKMTRIARSWTENLFFESNQQSSVNCCSGDVLRENLQKLALSRLGTCNAMLYCRECWMQSRNFTRFSTTVWTSLNKIEKIFAQYIQSGNQDSTHNFPWISSWNMQIILGFAECNFLPRFWHAWRWVWIAFLNMKVRFTPSLWPDHHWKRKNTSNPQTLPPYFPFKAQVSKHGVAVQDRTCSFGWNLLQASLFRPFLSRITSASHNCSTLA